MNNSMYVPNPMEELLLLEELQLVYADDGIVKTWKLNGKLHRTSGPAVTQENGPTGWFRHGNFHRENGPALILADGTEYWYIDGKRIDI